MLGLGILRRYMYVAKVFDNTYGRVYLRPKCQKSTFSVKLPPPKCQKSTFSVHPVRHGTYLHHTSGRASRARGEAKNHGELTGVSLNHSLVSLALAVDFHPVQTWSGSCRESAIYLGGAFGPVVATAKRSYPSRGRPPPRVRVQLAFRPGVVVHRRRRPGTLTAAHRSAVCPCAKQMGHAMGCENCAGPSGCSLRTAGVVAQPAVLASFLTVEIASTSVLWLMAEAMRRWRPAPPPTLLGIHLFSLARGGREC